MDHNFSVSCVLRIFFKFFVILKKSTEVVFVRRTNIHKHYRKTYHVIISRLEATELFLILIPEMRISDQLSIVGKGPLEEGGRQREHQRSGKTGEASPGGVPEVVQ